MERPLSCRRCCTAGRPTERSREAPRAAHGRSASSRGAAREVEAGARRGGGHAARQMRREIEQRIARALDRLDGHGVTAAPAGFPRRPVPTFVRRNDDMAIGDDDKAEGMWDKAKGKVKKAYGELTDDKA